MNSRSTVGFTVVALIGATLLPMSAFAQSSKADFGKRQARQHARIHEGIEAGTLTAGQARRLRARDARIHARAMSLRAKDGGHLTAEQREHINGRLNHVSKDIYKDKHHGK